MTSNKRTLISLAMLCLSLLLGIAMGSIIWSGVSSYQRKREAKRDAARAAEEQAKRDEMDRAMAEWRKTLNNPGYFDLVLSEYVRTELSDEYSVMLPDGACWHSLEYRARDDAEVSRDEIMSRIRSVFVTNGEWRISVRTSEDFGAKLIQIGEDDLWCEMIPYLGLYDRDIWCIHVSDDARTVYVYTKCYWGIGRQKPDEVAPTNASTTTNQFTPLRVTD